MAACQARLNCSAARRGRYVSVVPLSTIVPLPVFHVLSGTPMDLPFSSTSFSCTVNQPRVLRQRYELHRLLVDARIDAPKGHGPAALHEAHGERVVAELVRLAHRRHEGLGVHGHAHDAICFLRPE